MRKLILAAAVLALLASCAPPFNLDYSSAAVILGRMTRESELGPFKSTSPGSLSSNPLFFPVKTVSGVDCTRGFVYTTDVGGSVPFLGFISPDGLGGWSVFAQVTSNIYSALPTPPANQTLYHADPSYQRYIVAPIRTGDFVSFIDLDSAYPANRSISELVVPAASQSFSFYDFDFFTTLVGFGSPPEAVGMWVPPSLATTMPVFFLMWDSSLNVYHEGFGTLDTTVFAVTGDLNGALSLPFLPVDARVNYFHDAATNTSYASFFAGGAWQCWKWWFNAGVLTSVQLTGVTSRIDALLTNGELFSAQGGIGRVYDSGGNRKTSFPMGNLCFSYEEYVNGTPRLFFSMSIKKKDNDASLVVYSIATSDLDSLGF